MHRNRPLTILLSVLLVLSLACSFFGQVIGSQDPVQIPNQDSGQDTGRREVSAEPPTLPTPPIPAAAPGDTPDEQAVNYADQLATGENRLAVWMGLYDVLGIPIIGQDGVQLGSTGDDPIGPRYWQIWYASGLDLPGRGIPLADVGRLFANGLPELDGTDIGAMLLDDLRQAAQGDNSQVRLLGLFVRERILRGPSHVDILEAAVTPDTAVIDMPTVQLISWVMVREALFQAASQASVPGDSISMVVYHPQTVSQLGPEISCSDLPGADSTAVAWHKWILNKIGGGISLPGMTEEMALPSFVELVVGKIGGAAESTERIKKLSGKMLGGLNVITSAISLVLQLQAMEIDVSMEPWPLERTHKTKDGEEATLALRLYTDPKGRPDGNELESCMSSYFLNALGVSFAFPTAGNIPGAEIVVEGGKGIPELVLINEGRMRFTTGADGQVNIHLIGKGQKKTIPDSAPPVDKEFSIILSAQPEEAGLGSMANIFFGGLGGLANAPAFLSSLIDVLKTFHYDMGEKVLRVTDWSSPGYKISATSRWHLGEGTPYHQFDIVAKIENAVIMADEQGNLTGSATVNWTVATTVVAPNCNSVSFTVSPSQAVLTGQMDDSGSLAVNLSYQLATGSVAQVCRTATGTETTYYGLKMTPDPLSFSVASSGGTLNQSQVLIATGVYAGADLGTAPLAGSSDIVVIPEVEAGSLNPNNHEASWDDFLSLFGVLPAWRQEQCLIEGEVLRHNCHPNEGRSSH